MSEGYNYSAYEVLASRPFPALLSLYLIDMDLDDRAASILSGLKAPALNSILLGDNPITDKGFRSWVSKERYPNLTGLNMSSSVSMK